MSYNGIYTAGNVHDSYNMQLDIPYTKLQSNILEYTSEIGSSLSVVQCSYKYNHYYRLYEDKIRNLPEKLIPNMYIIQAYQNSDNEVGEIPEGFMVSGVKEFVNRNGRVTDLEVARLTNTLYVPSTHGMPPPDSSRDVAGAFFTNGYMDHNYYLRNYLTGAFYESTLSASISQKMSNIFSNIFFDKYFYSDLYDEIEENDRKNQFPFYVQINFDPPEDGTHLREAIETSNVSETANNSISTRFIKHLKEAYSDNSPRINDNRNYGVEMQYYTGSVEARTTTEYRTVGNMNIKTVDFKKLIIAMGQKETRYNNCFFMGPETFGDTIGMAQDKFDRIAAMDMDYNYGFISTMDYNKFLSAVTSVLTSSYGNDAPGTTIDMILNSANTDSDWYNGETLAYRVNKQVINQADQITRQIPDQDFWMYNAIELQNTTVNLYDSQVKYGQEYKYTVFAYVLGRGYKYNLTNAVATRQIASGSSGDYKYYCLQFNEPNSHEPSDQLYYLKGDDTMVYSEEAYATVPDVTNEFLTGTNTHIITEQQYLADMYMNYEPVFRIFEIPLLSKTVKVFDHPPNKLEINAYQILDNSQKICFSFLKDTFVQTKYPTPITSTDRSHKRDYLSSNDIVDYIGMEVTEKQVSRTKYVEIYRISEKPSSIADFDNNLYQTVNLTIREQPDFTYPTDIFHDTIKTNQKYYYLFRGLNEHLEGGYLSDIHEVELVDDGGYKYALFNVIRETDLEENQFTETTRTFKKLVEIVPNVSHTSLGTLGVDFDQQAYTQIDEVSVGRAEDPIWGKTFKMRLTSKKSGKKIDLNITYNLETET